MFKCIETWHNSHLSLFSCVNVASTLIASSARFHLCQSGKCQAFVKVKLCKPSAYFTFLRIFFKGKYFVKLFNFFVNRVVLWLASIIVFMQMFLWVFCNQVLSHECVSILRASLRFSGRYASIPSRKFAVLSASSSLKNLK